MALDSRHAATLCFLAEFADSFINQPPLVVPH